MMEPDDFLDWLEEKLDEARVVDPQQFSVEHLEKLIDDFNNEFDTRDSPPTQSLGSRKKK